MPEQNKKPLELKVHDTVIAVDSPTVTLNPIQYFRERPKIFKLNSAISLGIIIIGYFINPLGAFVIGLAEWVISSIAIPRIHYWLDERKRKSKKLTLHSRNH